MQFFFSSFATAILFFSYVTAFCFQDSTRVNRDSLKEKTIQFTPYFSKENEKSLGNYVAIVDDTLSFLRSSGISVFNTLRGVVPNSGISSNAPFATVRQNSLLVVDGIPYEEGINLYNLNAFDYSSVIALNRGNAASAYGAYGGNGAFILKSKTGENQIKPTVEFSSYLTIIPDDGKTSSVYLSNAIAYMQDFGKVDTRISYSNVQLPGNLGSGNFIKVNTGFNVSPAFNARLIIDCVQTRQKSSSYSTTTLYKDSLLIQDGDTSLILYDPYTVETHRRSKTMGSLLRGNLALQYQPFDWLVFTSQSAWGTVQDLDEDIINSQTTREEDKRSKSMTNFFGRVTKRLGTRFSFSSFVGIQYQMWKNERHINYDNTSNIFSNSSYDTKSFITGLDLNLGDFLYGQFIYRKDVISMYPPEQHTPTYSTSMAFVFSEAFGWTSHVFSFGKMRASVGKALTQIQNENTYYPTTPERLVETGTDLFFLKRRVGVTFNYFQEKLSSTRSFSPSTGFVDYGLNNRSLKTTGSEVVVTGYPIRTSNIEHKTVVLWMKTKSRFEGTSGTGNTPGILGNSFPNWTGSLFNQLTWKNFSWSFLIDMSNGSTFSNGGYGSWYAHEGTLVRLRDISFGVDIVDLHKIGFKQVHFSVSARSTFLLYSSSGKNIEENTPHSSYDKNISMGLSFRL